MINCYKGLDDIHLYVSVSLTKFPVSLVSVLLP